MSDEAFGPFMLRALPGGGVITDPHPVPWLERRVSEYRPRIEGGTMDHVWWDEPAPRVAGGWRRGGGNAHQRRIRRRAWMRRLRA